jgi:hypothetical protein
MVLTTQVVGVLVHLMQSVPCRGAHGTYVVGVATVHLMQSVLCRGGAWYTQVVGVATVHQMQSVTCRGGAWC